jgi:hypothetical protein
MRRLWALLSAASVLLFSSNAAAAKLIAVLPLDVTHTEGHLTPAAQADLEEIMRDVAADLLTPQGWTVLTGETTLQLLQDNGVDASKCGEESCSLAMAREIKAEKFLSGNVRYVDAVLTASIRLVDTATGRILASASLEGANERSLREDFHLKAADLFAKGGLLAAPVAPLLDAVTAKPVSPAHNVGLAGLVVGGAALVVGVALMVFAQTDAAALKQHPPATGTILSAQTSVNTRVTGSIAALAAGGAVAITGVCLTVAF